MTACTYRVIIRFAEPTDQANDFIATYRRGALPEYAMMFSSVDELAPQCAGWVVPATARGATCDEATSGAPPLGAMDAPSTAPNSRTSGLRSRELRVAAALVITSFLAVGAIVQLRTHIPEAVTAVALLGVMTFNVVRQQHGAQLRRLGGDHPTNAPVGQGAFRLRDYQTVSGAMMNADIDVTGDSLTLVVKSEPFVRFQAGVRLYSAGFTVRCAGSRSHRAESAVVATRCDIGGRAVGPTWTWRFNAATDTWSRDAFRTIRPGWRPQVFERVQSYDSLTG